MTTNLLPVRETAERAIHDLVTPEMAAHVLAHFNAGGFFPGSFTRQLIALMASADETNRLRLAFGFPGYAAAVGLAQNTDFGIAMLRQRFEELYQASEHVQEAPDAGE